MERETDVYLCEVVGTCVWVEYSQVVDLVVILVFGVQEPGAGRELQSQSVRRPRTHHLNQQQTEYSTVAQLTLRLPPGGLL